MQQEAHYHETMSQNMLTGGQQEWLKNKNIVIQGISPFPDLNSKVNLDLEWTISLQYLIGTRNSVSKPTCSNNPLFASNK